MEETIAAISTALGEAAIGVVRLSGPEAAAIAQRVLPGVEKAAKNIRDWPTHTLHLAEVQDPETQERMDSVLVGVMWGPNSYTGEDVVEFQGHGGRWVVQGVLQALLKAGARLAEPGEFTRRAYLNGRLDLAQAEAVIDLIKARSDGARRLALRQLGGQLSKQIYNLQDQLIRIVAGLEAVLDFPEEGISTPQEEKYSLFQVIQGLQELLAGAKQGRALREGIRVVIIGKPNVGKSSIWNSLIGEERAIVTATPGTTRDLLEEEIHVQGIPIRLVDTAGIRETTDLIEQIGVNKAREILRQGQVVLVVFDASLKIYPDDQKIVDLIKGLPIVLVVNKSDIVEPQISVAELSELFPQEPIIWTSVLAEKGLGEIKQAIVEKALGEFTQAGEETLVGSLRQEQALTRCLQDCQEALAALDAQLAPEFVLIDLRTALENLGEITGVEVGEAVIDRIFADFCIGK